MADRSNFDLSAQAWSTLRRLLREALDRPLAERSAWVANLPADLSDFEPRLRELLQHAEAPAEAQLFHTMPKVETDAFAAPPGEATGLEPAPGQRVGPYLLVRPIGEGGMASVWLAERTDMLRGRPVALKLPHLSWRHAGLAERMAREREILATLDHPHIARLYDAGIAEGGQPYLALEYVEGERLDQHAARLALGVQARLRLFLQVLDAVTHAHAHLAVHRDLKPSNILVGRDGQAKLLDFGIAKVLGDEPALESAVTQEGGRVLTPDYASPEQIAGQPIGTASDIYSLGVVLFELLTGSKPYRPARDSRAALEEAILGAEPPRPSAVAPAAVRKALRGDLDTIVAKALKKDPAARYATADAFARDIRHHLANEPVAARPDGRWYRLHKFLVRNRLGVATTGAVALAVLAGAGVAVWQARVAIAERDRAQDVLAFVESILREADPYEGSRGPMSAAALLQNAEHRVNQELRNRPALRVEILDLIGGGLKNLQETDAAARTLDAAIATARAALGPEHPLTVRARVTRLGLLRFQGKPEEIEAELRELLPQLRNAGGNVEELVEALQQQTHNAIDTGHYEQALASATETLDIARAQLGERDTHTAEAAILLVLAHEFMHQPAQARTAAETALRLATQVHPEQPRHPDVIGARVVLARALGELGEFRSSIDQLEQAVRDAKVQFGPNAIEVAFHTHNLVKYLVEAGELVRAEQAAAAAIVVFELHASPDSYFLPAARASHAMTLLAARRPDAALAEIESAAAQLQTLLGAEHPVARRARADLALAQALAGRADQAERLLIAAAPAAGKPGWREHGVLSIAARLSGRTAEALQQARAATAAIDGPLGPHVELIRMALLPLLGLALIDADALQEADAVLTEAADLLDRYQLSTSPERADAALGLGRVQLGLGRPDQALPHLARADAFWLQFDAGNRWAGEAAYWLARGQQAAGDADSARRSYARAANVLARSPLPVDASLVASARAALAIGASR